ncbi:YtzH-like family protein [Pseudogracilibacillus sp. ICA-222130]|uniref:YtzH-like family protein n=1 Tax=Pseudogracilibacillus sp. ICA-222130 TaxID=3134655 RepID=UPI0030C510B8
MCLTVHNQLTLLHDLLDEQLMYKTVELEEYRQIKKLVQCISCNKQTAQALENILPEIYSYSLKGERVQSYMDHIMTNEQAIKKWLQTIKKARKTIS